MVRQHNFVSNFILVKGYFLLWKDFFDRKSFYLHISMSERKHFQFKKSKIIFPVKTIYL